MQETTHIENALEETLADVEPPAFRDRLFEAFDDGSLTPGVLTMKTAHAIDPSVDVQASAQRGASVQLCYEGLRLTRSIIQEQQWDGSVERESYYLNLLTTSVLVSFGFTDLANSGVAHQSVEMVRRFGRNQTYEQVSRPENLEDSLEVDIIKLALNGGTDMVLSTIPPEIAAYGEQLSAELDDYPLPDPDVALSGVDEHIASLVGTQN